MNALFDFLAADTPLRAIVVAGSFGGAVVLVRYCLREMYAGERWRLARHWDA